MTGKGKLRSRLAIGALLLAAALAGLGWTFRAELVLALAASAKRDDIPPWRPVAWMRGPPPAAMIDPATGRRRPNIILIVADDLGINDVSTFGGGLAGGRIKTPAIDALAAGGAVFAQAYAGTASCAPSRAMMMTGRYPTRTGFEFTPIPDGMGRAVKLVSDARAGRSGLPPVIFHADAQAKSARFQDQGLPGSEVTIAEVLKGAGYHTVHIGKWHTGLGPEFGPSAQGFDETLLMESGLHLPADHPDVVNAPIDFDPVDAFLWARMEFATSYNGGEWFEPGGYLSDHWTDQAIEVIRANANRPFFLKLAHWGVHSPLQATRADYEAVGPVGDHRARVYAAMIRALDRSVARVVAAVEAQGLAEDTLIVFTSDNGAPGYIGVAGVNAPYRGWKLSLFEGGIRVPLFLRWPSAIKPGTRVEAPAAHIDLMPTLAAAAGARPPPGVAIDGADLMPFARGLAAPGARPHDTLFWQSGAYQVVRDGDWKLQITDRPARVWLFDLARDPTERNDLAAARPEIVARLKGLLAAHRANARPPLHPAILEAPVPIDRTLADPARPGEVIVHWPN
jgi:uncharacterized sulfatase